jgi:hypothetical protein
VVPNGNECVVVVRVHEMPTATTFYIVELSGSPVIEVELSPPVWADTLAGRGQEEGPPIVTLRAAAGPKSILAYCKTGSQSGGRRCVYIYDAQDEIFGHVTKVMTFGQMRSQLQAGSGSESLPAPAADMSNPCYVFTSGRASLQLLFDGSLRERTISVTDNQHRILAESEPCSPSFDASGAYYKLRVTEAVDAGLMICALQAIGQMELLRS